ncbi:MAG TPA: class I SAM-dependent methyltransferase [Telmatospirillum sp.]|nr:class I SAM-dependent methyltransferase [Telmatospirillum sp.]
MSHHAASKDDPFDTATLRFYAEEAPIYSGSGPGGISRHLGSFLRRLAPGARILELGCGGGRDAEAMVASGFHVDPTEGVPEIAHQAEQRLMRKVRVMRFDELDAVKAYDAVWASASLIHVPRSSLPEVIRLVFRALRPGGLHFATYKAGGVEGRDSKGRYYNYLSPDQLLDVYHRSSSWEDVEILEYKGGGFDGGEGPWVAIAARRPAGG